MAPQHTALPAAGLLSLALPILLFSSLSLTPPLIWVIPGVRFWGRTSITPYKCNLHHLLLSQPLEPPETENTGYWEAHGLLAV